MNKVKMTVRLKPLTIGQGAREPTRVSAKRLRRKGLIKEMILSLKRKGCEGRAREV